MILIVEDPVILFSHKRLLTQSDFVKTFFFFIQLLFYFICFNFFKRDGPIGWAFGEVLNELMSLILSAFLHSYKHNMDR